MSFVGPVGGFLVQEDKSLLAEEYDGESASSPVILDLYVGEERLYGDGYCSPWWPAPGALLPDSGLYDPQRSIWYQGVYPTAGCNGRLGFVGVTRDQYGSALPNCTVRCFLTSTTELVSTVTSDANGAYIATTPYSGAHFITVHCASPAVAGASLDTIMAS